MKFIFFGILLMLLPGFSFETKNNFTESNTDSILWNLKTKLTWDDFQGTPDEKSSYKALTYSTVIANHIKVSDEIIEYDISCLFEKKLSWSKNKKSSELLKHEQLHFDIAELATRRMRQKFLAFENFELKNINNMVREIFKEEENERKTLNREYDTETKHGLIKDKQKEWEVKIAKELKELNKYSNTRVVITRMK